MKLVAANNNFISYIFLFFAFFIILFVLKNQFFDLQVAREAQAQISQELEDEKKNLEELNTLQSQIADPENLDTQKVKKLAADASEKSLLENIYYFVSRQNAQSNVILIKNIMIGNEEQSDIGFKKKDISLSLVIASENILYDVLDFFAKGNETYEFFIPSFSYSMNSNGNLQVNIPLTLYYR